MFVVATVIYIFCNTCIVLSLQNFLIYAAAFYGNLGNYKSFGDTKFIPDLPKVFLFLYGIYFCIYQNCFKENLTLL